VRVLRAGILAMTEGRSAPSDEQQIGDRLEKQAFHGDGHASANPEDKRARETLIDP
jgi:hypothetical protein